MKVPIIVTAAIIQKGDKVLLTQRKKNQHNGLRWEFPGGKPEFGEDLRDCLEREIKEELGIKIKANNILDYSSHVYGGEKHIVLIAFNCDYVSGEIEKKEINDFAWVSSKDLEDYDITEADISLIKSIR